ncbi:MAG: hypothetical protein ACKO8G_01960 [Actinomycetota bacterium]
MGNLLQILLPAAVVVLLAAGYLRNRIARETAGGVGGGPTEPLWATPAGFALLAGLVLVVGLLVAPRLLGVTFLLLPYLWSRGPG